MALQSENYFYDIFYQTTDYALFFWKTKVSIVRTLWLNFEHR